MSPITRNDVARAAGVSTAVVSYVLNDGPRRVSADRRQRVVQAIADLGYRRDPVAAALSSGRGGTIGLLVPDASNPFFADLARRIEDAAFARGYTVLIGNAAEDRDRETRHLDAFIAQRAAGVIACLADVASDLPRQIEQLADRLVLIDRVPRGWTGRAIAIDNDEGGRLAASRLVARGCHHCMVIAGPPGFEHVERRVAGFLGALPKSVDARVVSARSFGFLDGATIARGALDRRTDALFCCTDALAIGALAAIAESGRSVPGDIAVVGYDDVPQARATFPPLTTIAQPADEMARLAVAALLDGETVPRGLLRPILVVRESA